MKTILFVALGALCIAQLAAFAFDQKVFSFLPRTKRTTQRWLRIPGYEVFKDEAEKKDAYLYMLECLTTDLDDLSFENMKKQDRRARLIKDNSFTNVCAEMERKGLRVSNDKIDMLIRLLNFEIDPTSVQRQKFTGAEVRFVNEEDIASGVVEVVPESERKELVKQMMENPDASDLVEMRQDRRMTKEPVVLGDDFLRREFTIPHSEIKRQGALATQASSPINCYEVAPDKSVFTWIKNILPVVVMIPDHSGWDSTTMRDAADYISRVNKARVLVPDVYLGQTSHVNSSIPEVIEWTKRVDSEQATDIILSTMLYARENSPSCSLSLFGVGYGGGRAHELACDLYSVAFWCEAQELLQVPGIAQEQWGPQTLQEVMEIHSRHNLFRPVKGGEGLVRPHPRWHSPGREQEGEGELVTDETLKRDTKLATDMLAEQLRQEREAEQLAEKRKAYREIHGSLEGYEELKEVGREEDDDEEEDEYGEENGGTTEEEDEQLGDISVDDFTPEQLEEIQKSIADPNYNMTGVTLDVEKITRALTGHTSSRKRKRQAIAGAEGNDTTTTAGTAVDTSPPPSSLADSSFRQVLDEELAKLRAQVNCVLNRSLHLEPRLQFDGPSGMATARSIAALAPQGVCTVQASFYDEIKVGRQMIAPTRIIHWLRDETPGCRQVDHYHLYNTLKQRMNEVLDYNFVMMELGDSRSFRFPKDDIDATTRRRALQDAATWLDTFQSRTGKEFIMTAGIHKLYRKSTFKIYDSGMIRAIAAERRRRGMDEPVDPNSPFRMRARLERAVDRQLPLGIVEGPQQ